MFTSGLASFVMEIPNFANTQSKSDWLCNTPRTRLLQGDQLILENNEKACPIGCCEIRDRRKFPGEI